MIEASGSRFLFKSLGGCEFQQVAMAMCPGDTTEWDDIQRKFGNLPQLQKEVPQRELDQRLIESADSWKPIL